MIKKLKAIKDTEGGFFNTWTETKWINASQVRKVTKYNFHKWCFFKVTNYETNMDTFAKS
ncbi:MAG: hypothetical protein COA47_10235 [Robiginitomaculum sp.]|nr:MAG: hypothetical protein COA47_10235 [Robiginitomaculum sp.]